jgi:hypothetical protein
MRKWILALFFLALMIPTGFSCVTPRMKINDRYSNEALVSNGSSFDMTVIISNDNCQYEQRNIITYAYNLPPGVRYVNQSVPYLNLSDVAFINTQISIPWNVSDGFYPGVFYTMNQNFSIKSDLWITVKSNASLGVLAPENQTNETVPELDIPVAHLPNTTNPEPGGLPAPPPSPPAQPPQQPPAPPDTAKTPEDKVNVVVTQYLPILLVAILVVIVMVVVLRIMNSKKEEPELTLPQVPHY